jgi:transcriptional regulator with XRE-family HTH domain
MESRRLIAHNVKRIRLERRQTQEALALDAGIDRTYLSDLERAVGNPSVDILDRLARVLTVKTADFFAELSNNPKLKALPRGRRGKAKKPRN